MRIDYTDIAKIQSALSKVDMSIPIKKYPQDSYGPEEVREILRIMLDQLEWVKSHPNQDDPYGTTKSDWQDEFAIMQGLADYYGITI